MLLSVISVALFVGGLVLALFLIANRLTDNKRIPWKWVGFGLALAIIGGFLFRYRDDQVLEADKQDPRAVYQPHVIKQIHPPDAPSFASAIPVRFIIIANEQGDRWELILSRYWPDIKVDQTVWVNGYGRTKYQQQGIPGPGFDAITPEYFIRVADLLTDPTVTPTPTASP